MWDFAFRKYDKKAYEEKRKLRLAWEKFYTPLQMSQAKFRIKVNQITLKGKYPKI